MPFSLQDFVDGGLLPAIVAAGLALVLRRWTRGEFAKRLANSLPFVAGFHVGYWLLSLGRPAPGSHWEWLPWVLLLSCVGSLPPDARLSRRLVRYALVVVAVIASCRVLVPQWDHLDPSREIHMAILAGSVWVLTALLEPLTQRIAGWKFLALLAAVLIATAVILAFSGSLRFAQIAGCGVAALAGMAGVTWITGVDHPAAGIALPYSLIAAALMVIGQVNSFSDVPLISYVLPPLAPLALWPLAAGPWARSSGPRRWLLRGLPILICLFAVALAAIA